MPFSALRRFAGRAERVPYRALVRAARPSTLVFQRSPIKAARVVRVRRAEKRAAAPGTRGATKGGPPRLQVLQ